MIFIDQMDREVQLNDRPKRIISLVPSQTELLADLGLDEEVIGITKFCIYPEEWFRSKTRVGGTKQLNIELIRSLNPDLIIGNKEENTAEDILSLEDIAPVWMSDIYTFEDALKMIVSVGDVVCKKRESEQMVLKIQEKFNQINKKEKKRKVLYFIWKDPEFIAGKNTFIDAMLDAIGCENCCQLERYPALTAIKTPHPDFIFLSSEPYPFKEEHKDYFKAIFPNAKIVFVDGEMFSWYGSRMLLAPAYFQRLANELAIDEIGD
jgi:ABC-type Fe3+-hydroxamate transport system substrate-binding protein